MNFSLLPSFAIVPSIVADIYLAEVGRVIFVEFLSNSISSFIVTREINATTLSEPTGIIKYEFIRAIS